MMKRLLVIAGAVVALGACAHQTPEQTVYAAKGTLATAELSATVYVKLPRCSAIQSVPVCSDPARVATILKAANAGKAAVDSAEAVVRDPSAPGSASLKAAQAASAAVAALLALVPAPTKGGL